MLEVNSFLKSFSLRSRQTGEKIKKQERYETAALLVGNVTDTADYEVPLKVGHNPACEHYSYLHH